MATISGKNPRRDQILQERIYDRLEAQYSRRIAFEIARTMKDAAKHIGEPMFLEDAMAEHRVRMAKRLEGLWSDSSTEMMEHINGQALKSYDVLNTPLANQIASDWLLSYGLKKITQIVDTTREDINSVIDRGIADGLSEVEIASMIQSIAPMKSISRAATIARTEVVAASQNAAYQTASVIGVPMVKRWVSSGGERTRESHQIANGQVVGIHEKFRVGDSLLMHPGDPDGSAREVINCRCACVYEIAGVDGVQSSTSTDSAQQQTQAVPVVSLGADAEYDAYVASIRDDAKRVIDKLPKPLEILSNGAFKGSYYSAGKNLSSGKIGTLVVAKDSLGKETLLHEYGHHIDHVLLGKHGQPFAQSQMSMQKPFLDAREKDAAHLKEIYSGKNMFEELKKKVSGKKELAGLSDVFDSMSGGVFHDKYGMPGHGVKYYNKKTISGKTAAQVREINTSTKQAETFANMHQAWSENGEAWSEMQKVFPNQSKVFAETMEEYAQ